MNLNLICKNFNLICPENLEPIKLRSKKLLDEKIKCNKNVLTNNFFPDFFLVKKFKNFATKKLVKKHFS